MGTQDGDSTGGSAQQSMLSTFDMGKLLSMFPLSTARYVVGGCICAYRRGPERADGINDDSMISRSASLVEMRIVEI